MIEKIKNSCPRAQACDHVLDHFKLEIFKMKKMWVDSEKFFVVQSRAVL